METQMLCNRLQAILISDVPAPEEFLLTVCRFTETYSNHVSPEPLVKYDQHIQQLLCSALEHNHTELVSHLLDDKYFKGCSAERIRQPLLCAMRSSRAELVELTLQAPVAKDLAKDCTSIPQLIDREPLIIVSPIEYACQLNQPAMLKHLIDYDRRFNTYTAGCTQIIPAHLGYGYEEECITPLRIVINIVESMDRFTKEYLPMVEAVRLILDAGDAGVNIHDERGFTALHHLLKQMQGQSFSNLDSYARNHERLITITRLLLEAGSDTTGPPRCTPLDTLLDLLFTEDRMLRYSPASHYIARLKLVAELIKLVLQYGGRTTNITRPLCPTYIKVFTFCASMLKRIKRLPISSDVVDNVMSIWADIFESFVLSRQKFDYTNRLGVWLAKGKLFWTSFMCIMKSCRQSTIRARIIRLMLEASSASHRFSFTRALLQRLGKARDSAWDDITRCEISEEIQWYTGLVKDITCQTSLQYLAKRAILRAMSYRSLGSDFELPLTKCMMEYVFPPTISPSNPSLLSS